MKAYLIQPLISIVYILTIILLFNKVNSDGGGRAYVIFFSTLLAAAIHLIITITLLNSKIWDVHYLYAYLIITSICIGGMVFIFN